ncbi:MAG: hypothetical protein H6618_00190 [Deltaproteobacteria bacterium]|nr:hypothetical protein [Deltaproteobacteria bacterium]
MSLKKIEALEARLQDKKNLPLKIQIAGMQFELPEGINSFGKLKEVLRSKTSLYSNFKSKRSFYDPKVLSELEGSEKNISFQGSFINNPLNFAPEKFNISVKDAKQLDPQHRLCLHLVEGAIRSSCLEPEQLSGKKVGVFVSTGEVDYAKSHGQALSKINGYTKWSFALGLTHPFAKC